MSLRSADGSEVEDGGPFSGMSGTVAPGLVDLQVNGGFGYDFTTEPASIWEVGRLLPRYGVTAFLPTVITAPLGSASEALETLANGPPPGWIGATPLGLHVEGPMISPERRGTHPKEDLAVPSSRLIEGLITAGPPLMVTIAPELPGAEPAVRRLAEAGTIVALGHSDASADTALAAIAWGATHATHLFNAMSGLHHREPGLAAAILTDERLTVGLIADGVHVDPVMLRLALRILGPDRICLVTDAMAAMGATGGAQRIGSLPVTVDGITVRNRDGRLAGSAATLDHVVRTMVNATGCSLADAVTMASVTPARIAHHVPDDGDLVLLDDDLRVKATAIGGRVVHRQ